MRSSRRPQAGRCSPEPATRVSHKAMGARSPMCDLPVVRCSNICCALRHSWRARWRNIFAPPSPAPSSPKPNDGARVMGLGGLTTGPQGGQGRGSPIPPAYTTTTDPPRPVDHWEACLMRDYAVQHTSRGHACPCPTSSQRRRYPQRVAVPMARPCACAWT